MEEERSYLTLVLSHGPILKAVSSPMEKGSPLQMKLVARDPGVRGRQLNARTRRQYRERQWIRVSFGEKELRTDRPWSQDFG